MEIGELLSVNITITKVGANRFQSKIDSKFRIQFFVHFSLLFLKLRVKLFEQTVLKDFNEMI